MDNSIVITPTELTWRNMIWMHEADKEWRHKRTYRRRNKNRKQMAAHMKWGYKTHCSTRNWNKKNYSLSHVSLSIPRTSTPYTNQLQILCPIHTSRNSSEILHILTDLQLISKFTLSVSLRRDLNETLPNTMQDWCTSNCDVTLVSLASHNFVHASHHYFWQ